MFLMRLDIAFVQHDTCCVTSTLCLVLHIVIVELSNHPNIRQYMLSQMTNKSVKVVQVEARYYTRPKDDKRKHRYLDR